MSYLLSFFFGHKLIINAIALSPLKYFNKKLGFIQIDLYMTMSFVLVRSSSSRDCTNIKGAKPISSDLLSK